MSEHHPRRETLEGFLLQPPAGRRDERHAGPPAGRLRALPGRDVAARRPRCSRPDSAPEPRLSAAEEDAYELAISAAFTKALARERRWRSSARRGERRAEELLRAVRRPETPALPEGAVSWGLCELLLEKSGELRQTDPAGMLHLANLARRAADRLASGGLRRRASAPTCRPAPGPSWPTPTASPKTSPRPRRRWPAPSTCARRGRAMPLLYARIADLDASLLCDQRRFKEAFRMLDLALRGPPPPQRAARGRPGAHPQGAVYRLCRQARGGAPAPRPGPADDRPRARRRSSSSARCTTSSSSGSSSASTRPPSASSSGCGRSTPRTPPGSTW